MATLKEYLEKVALKVGSRGAMPGASGSIGYSGVSSFIAPADGWALFSAKSGVANDWMVLQNNARSFSASAAPYAGYAPAVFLPVRKGDTVKAGKGSTMSTQWLTFIKSVGGGLKSLIYKLFPEVRHAYA